MAQTHSLSSLEPQRFPRLWVLHAPPPPRCNPPPPRCKGQGKYKALSGLHNQGLTKLMEWT